jgi:hypothetical protein
MRVFLAFLAGLVVSYLAIVAGAFWYMHAAGIFDRDGGMSMGIVFATGPLGALIGGTIAAVTVYMRRPAPRPTPATTPDASPQARAIRIGLIATLAGAAGYLAGGLGLWSQSGASYESYWTALLVTWSPILLGLAAASLAAWLAARARAHA